MTKFSSKPKKLDDFMENDEEDYDVDVDIPADLTDEPRLKLATALTAAPDEIDADPFDDISFDEDRQGGTTDDEREVQLYKQFHRVIQMFGPKNDEKVVLDACDKLNEMGMKNPDSIRHMMTQHGGNTHYQHIHHSKII